MFDIEAYLDQCLSVGRKKRPTVLLADSADPRFLEASLALTRFARLVFLASAREVRDNLERDLGHLDADRTAYVLTESAFAEPGGPAFAPSGEAGPAPAGWSETAWAGLRALDRGYTDLLACVAGLPGPGAPTALAAGLEAKKPAGEMVLFAFPGSTGSNGAPLSVVALGCVSETAFPSTASLAERLAAACGAARALIPVSEAAVLDAVLVETPGGDPRFAKAVEEATGLLKAGATASPDLVSVRLRRAPAVEEALSGGAQVLLFPERPPMEALSDFLSARFPLARRLNVALGAGAGLVPLRHRCTMDEVRLSVKAAAALLLRDAERPRATGDMFFPGHRILAINPGSTSTKISVYEGENERFTVELQHSAEELLPFEGKSITAQYAFRKETILKALEAHGLSLDDIEAVSARGGLIRPIPHGTYFVNRPMVDDLQAGYGGEHASNLGGLIAFDLVGQTGKPAFIVDPVVVDEAPERVKITGLKAFRRKIISHALNQIASARRYAEENETFYERLNLIVAHMGGGISIGAHKRGHYLDVNNALDGEGPFTPQRSGSLPVGQLIEACFSGQYTKADLKKLNKGQGGLIDLLGTADLRELERRYYEGDREVVAVFEAQAYQIAKWITCLLPAFDGENVDQVILTGGMARCKPHVEKITRYVAALHCGVTVYPGENEMFALVKGALRVLEGKEEAKTYSVDKE